MEKMKIRICSVMIVLSLVSCHQFYIDSQPEFPPKVETDAMEAYNVLARSSKPVTFTISSNTPWHIYSDSEWCVPTPAMSSASSLIADITVNVQNNESEQPRTATLTIKGENVDEDIIISIKQDAVSELQVEAADNSKIPMEGGVKSILVYSNKAWNAKSDKLWLELDKTEGAIGEIDEIKVSAKASDGSLRSAIITVSNGVERKEIEVTQDGQTLRFVDVLSTDLAYTYTGGERFYRVESNIEWKANCSDTDIELIQNSDGITVRVPWSSRFKKTNATITISPVDVTSGNIQSESIVISRDPIAAPDAGSVTINQDGSATLTTTGAKTRLKTVCAFTFGTFEWKFSNMAVTAGCFHLNNWGNGDMQYQIFFGGTNRLVSGGTSSDGIGFWQNEAYFSHKYTTEELNSITTIKVEVMPYGDKKQIYFKAWVNGEQVLDDWARKNPWGSGSTEKGLTYWFGLFDNSVGTITIDSFQHTPAEL